MHAAPSCSAGLRLDFRTAHAAASGARPNRCGPSRALHTPSL